MSGTSGSGWGGADTSGDGEANRVGRWPSLDVLVGIAAGVLLMGSVWFAVSSGTEQPAGGTDAQPVSEPSSTILGTQAGAPSTTQTGKPPMPTLLARCRGVAAAQGAPLRAARPALDQWEIHVGAMNKLVVGAISLDQATAFWAQTRVGAARRIRDFDAADSEFRRAVVTCPKRVRSAEASPELLACARAVVARNDALRAARTSTATWDQHVQDMEMLRMGHMTPAKATQMWLASWRAGVRELDAYHDAVRKMRGEHC